MRPGLGPVFPGVRRSVCADVVVLPIQRRPILIVYLERGAIILAVVAKHRTAFLQPATVPDQYVPEIVADLMTEVAEQGPVRLTHLRAAALAHDIVRFFQGYGNDAIVMAREDLRSSRGTAAGEEIEGQAVLRIV